MLCTDGEYVFVAGKAMRKLRANSSVSQWAYNVVIGGIKGVTFIISAFINPNNKKTNISGDQFKLYKNIDNCMVFRQLLTQSEKQ